MNNHHNNYNKRNVAMVEVAREDVTDNNIPGGVGSARPVRALGQEAFSSVKGWRL